jgi:hypothetical protein
MKFNEPAIKYNLKFFVFSQMAINNYLTEIEDFDYNTLFVVIIDLYEDFLVSGFDEPSKKYQEAMQQYFANLIG